MKTKFIAFMLLILLSCFVFCSCVTEPDRVTPVVDDTARFQYIGSDEVNPNSSGEAAEVAQYYLDNETNIIYVVILNRAGNGTWAGLTPLLDGDGTYVTYDEFRKAD